MTKTMAEMKEIDRIAIEEYHIPSLELMENAAMHVTEAADAYLKGAGNIVIFAGAGNNGGDGLAAARQLALRGYQVTTFLVGNPEKMTNDCKANAARMQEINLPLLPFDPDDSALHTALSASALIIDAVFGVGITREVQGIYKTAIDFMNASGKYILSCDIPSGLNGDTGEIMGVCVNASETITFSAAKQGLLLNDGPKVSGAIHVVDIGIPEELLK